MHNFYSNLRRVFQSTIITHKLIIGIGVLSIRKMAGKFDSKSVIASLRASRNSSIVSGSTSTNTTILRSQEAESELAYDCRKSLEVLNSLVEDSQLVESKKEAIKSAMNMAPHNPKKFKLRKENNSNENEDGSDDNADCDSDGMRQQESKASETFGEDELEFYRNLIVNDEGKQRDRQAAAAAAATTDRQKKKKETSSHENKRRQKKVVGRYSSKKRVQNSDSDSSWSDFDEDAENEKIFGTKINDKSSSRRDKEKKFSGGVDGDADAVGDFESNLKKMMAAGNGYDDSAPPSDDSFSDFDGDEDEDEDEEERDDNMDDLDLGVDLKQFDKYDDMLDSGAGYLSSDSEKGNVNKQIPQAKKNQNKSVGAKSSSSSSSRVMERQHNDESKQSEPDRGDEDEDEDEWVLKEFERRLKIAKEMNDDMHDVQATEDSANHTSKRNPNRARRNIPAITSKRDENNNARAKATSQKNAERNSFSRTAPMSTNFKIDIKPGQRMKIHRRGSASSSREGGNEPPKWC